MSLSYSQVVSFVISVLTNPWTIAIVGGLIVAWVSRFSFSRKDKKEYLQKVLSANNEVIYSLRPLITESAFPTSGILESLISATARKYAIETGDMNSPGQFIDELVKEVMDSSFIPHKKKSEYSAHLIELKRETHQQINPRDAVKKSEAVINYKQQLTNYASLTLGLMVTLFTLLISFDNKSVPTWRFFSAEYINLLLPLLLAFLAVLLAMLGMYLMNKDGDFEKVYDALDKFFSTKSRRE